MIASNSTNNKLKASKGPKESDGSPLLAPSEEKSRGNEKGEGDKDRFIDSQGKNAFTNVVYSRERSKPRSKHRDDFRITRGTGERRGGSNSRGRGNAQRKIDKDEAFLPRGKLQEPLIKGKSSDGAGISSSKFGIDGDGEKSKSSDYGMYMGLPEDSRISKVLRRMSREDDPDKFIAFCSQLQEAVVAVDNARYIRRALDLICDSLLDMLHSGPNSEAKLQAAKCLAKLGYTLEHDFKRFMDWLFHNYTVERNDDVRSLLLKAILEPYRLSKPVLFRLDKKSTTSGVVSPWMSDHLGLPCAVGRASEIVRLEAEQPILKYFALDLMNHLHLVLEGVDKAHLLLVAVEAILNFASIYPDTFTKYFTDTVDILVGWHIDLTTPQSVTCYASQSLRRLSRYWANDIDFSITMLGHFLEDTEAYADELMDPSVLPDDESLTLLNKEEKMIKVTSFIKVFNSVMKGLDQHLSPSASPAVSWTFLYDCFSRMLTVFFKGLRVFLDLELLITGNECTWLLLNLLQNKTCAAHDDLYKLLDHEMAIIDDLNEIAIASTLQLVAKVVKELSANLPLELVQRILHPGSPILHLRLSPSELVHSAVVAVYHSLLSLKNIPLLKEAYRLILTDLDSAYQVVLGELEPLYAGIEPSDRTTYIHCDAEKIILFHIKALTDIANASNSLIGMWVLQPSILDLLAVKLIPNTIGKVSSHLFYTQLYLLYSHSSRHSHFITTSSLVGVSGGRPVVNSLLGLASCEMTQLSPTVGHLSIILRLLSNLINQDTCEESKLLSLTWCCELLSQARSYLTTLASTEQMTALVLALCTCATKSLSPPVLLATCINLQQLLITPYTLYWKKYILENIFDVCLLHLGANNSYVASHYSDLMLRLPWTIVVPNLSKGLVRTKSARKKIEVAQHAQLTHDANTGEMPAHHFKQYISYLLHGNKSGPDWLQEMFCSCWSLSHSEPNDHSGLRELALTSTTVLLQWASWETAQLCVNSKLRTPLGKPLDTFMAFEGAIKSLARQTVGSLPPEGSEEFDVRRVRLLLEFVEQLEKSIYNASDGTASALILPAKPVRTFFHTNKSTCNEWLSRNRSAVLVVALYAGMATSAVRHGYALLQDLLDVGYTKGSDFQKTVMQVSWALLKLKESEAIQGLYVWCRDFVGIKLPYLKAMADHAACKLEMAVESYVDLINNEGVESLVKDASLDPELPEEIGQTTTTLVTDQITECYLALQDWEGLSKWKSHEAEILKNHNGSSIRYKYITEKDAEVYLQFEKGELTTMEGLMEWPKEVEFKKPVWDCFHALGSARHKIDTIAMKSAVGGIILNSEKEVLRECQTSAKCYLVEALRNTPSEVFHDAVILDFAASAMLSEGDVILDCPDSCFKSNHNNVDSTLLARILWWGQVLEKLQITSQASPQLCLDASRLARKEGNLKLSLRLLSKHLNQTLHQDKGNVANLVLTDSILSDMELCALPWTLLQAMTFTQLSKLLYSVGRHDLAIAVGAKACRQLSSSDDSAVKEKCARLLLTVAKWISSLDQSALSNSLQYLQAWPSDTPVAPSLLDISKFDTEDDKVGSVLHLAVTHCPSLGKAWVQLANWAYRWGRKVTDQLLTPSDKEQIHLLMPDDVQDKDSVYTILTQTRPALDDDDIEVENINTSEMIEWQLQRLGSFNPEQLAGLVEMWRKYHARTYNFYQLSVQCYFKYLLLCECPQEDSAAITACLRLLRLIVKYAEELQSVLEGGLATTPTPPWVCIIPQLFSRLSHPQPYVRRRVSELLCRLAANKPHLIIFPSVVGSDAGAATIREMPHAKLFVTARNMEEDLDIDEDEEDVEEEDEENNDVEESQEMENCFQAMVDILAKQDPEAIAQVQVFVRELRRITLLWDELWLGTLVQHHTDMSRRIQQLELEVSMVDDNAHLSNADKDRLVGEKHRIILKPLLFVLEQLYTITSVQAETPHEIWFQEKFGESISETLEKLRNPSDPRKPGEAWSALKMLQVKLQQRATKRASYSLKMQDISPTLAQMRATQIAMPGITSALTVDTILDHVAILPTKTKPKKLIFQGSDGKSYTYLFKGLEDLHLDERIMQFLSIANTMLRGSGYHARHYAVIPLGVRSGLISWVERVTPIFSLYKRWQQRQATLNQTTVMRPSELFYAKLNPLLNDCDVTKPENRKEWPLAVLKQVLTELMQETPTYLLSRELWCDSFNAGGWWQSTKLYSTSMAVMSIIGYIIGLGDRHLDNVLVDLTTGQVIHIDYNVCFEKGKSLRVPEKVPFRLTPNLRAALGVTGVEGLFRLTCEHVLGVMKKGRETVLTLLEAFVYDPLIDWTPGSETGYTGAVYGGGRAVALETKQSRKQLEKEVTTAMFAIRLAEMRHDWLDNRDKIMTKLSELKESTEQWLDESAKLKVAEERLQERHQQLALVKEAEAHAQHDLYSLPARYSAYRATADTTDKALIALHAKIDDSAQQIQQYKMALCYFYGPQMAQWMAEINSRQQPEKYLVFDLIKEFLQNAGQGQMVQQCVQSEKELSELCCQQTSVTRMCLDLLGQYAAIVRQFPASHINHHRLSLYHRWSSTLLDTPFIESCEIVLNEMKACLSPPPLTQATLVLGYNMALQRLLAESRASIERLAERAPNVPVGDKALERADPRALLCVVITALCNLNKRFLVMESAAKSAMDCLVDLTSQKGEWFFDDMCLTITIMTKLVSLLPAPDPDSHLHYAVKCVHAAHNQYKSLQELNSNFTSIILPEAIQTIQREDASVLSLIAELDSIVASVQVPLGDLVAQLQMHLHFVILGMESPQAHCQEVARCLQDAVEGMFQRLGTAEPLTPGQMLFMGFNGLFDNLGLGSCSLISALTTLTTPTAWKTVDQLRDAKMITALVYDSTPRAILDCIFLVKRLQAMQELFMLCRVSAESFKGSGVTLPYDDERLSRPIRCFTADYVSYQLLGVFSYTFAITLCILLQELGMNVTGEVEQREVGADSRVALEELCRVAVDGCLRRGLVTSASLSQASGAVSGSEVAWRAVQHNQRLAQDLQRAELTTQRLQLQLTAHCWLHEDTLAGHVSSPISRPALMLELRKVSSALISIQPQLAEALEQQTTLVASAEQRLKWASGANPALAEVMCAFEAAVNSNNAELMIEQRLGALVVNLCNSVLLYEALRTRTSEAQANDAGFVQLVEACQQSCLLQQTLNTQLTPLEQSLVKLCPPGPLVDWKWISKAESLISDSVKKLVQEIEPQNAELLAAFDSIKTTVIAIRALLATHYRTMVDARSLLKTMVKFEEAGVSYYLNCYRAYTERLTALIKTILGLDDLNPEKAHIIIHEITAIQEETPEVYEELMRLSPEGENTPDTKRPPLVRQDMVCVSPKRDPLTGKAVQERNSYALSVWRRVRWKLEGKDPDRSCKYTVQEQVDWAINEATSLDNLALLYEGWTPWV